jgi:hypothetical protein
MLRRKKWLPPRDECPPACPPAEPKSTPSKAQGEPEPQKSKAQGEPEAPKAAAQGNPQAVPQQMMAAGGTPMLPPFAQVPTIRGGLALSIGLDWIHIPIPFPRIRTVEAPPETSMAYVGMPTQPAMGAMAAPMMAAAQFHGAQAEGQQCYTPEQIAAAMALVRRQQNGNGAGAAASNSNYESELKKREKELEEKAERLQKATEKLDKLLKDKGASMQPPALPRTDWESNDPWKQHAMYRRGEWK